MTEYGLVYYDVPSTQLNLYYKIKRLINKTCLPVNLSVYIFDWGLKPTLESRLQKMNAFTNANVHIVKFDNSSSEKLELLATTQLERMFENIKSRIHQTLEKAETFEKKCNYLDRLTRKIKNYERLITIYSFVKKVEPALKTLRKVIDKEYELIKQGEQNG